MNKMARFIFALLFALAIPATGFADITIFHVNDTHARSNVLIHYDPVEYLQ